MVLSDLAVRQAKATGKDRSLADFDGLYLFVPVQGRKAWHFRYYYVGKRERFSLGTYPEVSLREARDLRDEARALLAKGINPRNERKRKRQAIVLAGADTFMAVYKKWLAHRQLSLDECRQGSYDQIQRVFKANVFPVLGNLTVHEITQAHLLDIIGKVEARGSLSVAEKLRTWLNQLFSYIKVVVTGIKENPAADLDVVALPLPPVDHNPFLRMGELPAMLQTLRKYRGRLKTQLGFGRHCSTCWPDSMNTPGCWANWSFRRIVRRWPRHWAVILRVRWPHPSTHCSANCWKAFATY